MKHLIYITFAWVSTFTFNDGYTQFGNGNYQKANVNQTTNNTTLSLVKEGVYFLKIVETNKYAAIEGISSNNGAKLVQWEFSNNLNHQFQISATTDAGYYFIKALHSNKFLNVEGQKTNDGTAICQWDFVNQDNLKWSFTYVSSSQTYIIRNKQSGKALGLQTAINDSKNGNVLSINSNPLAGTQNFLLQPVSLTKVTNSGNLKTQAYVSNQIQLKLTDGTVVSRQINPLYQTIKNTNTVQKRIIKTEKADETCETKTAKIDMDTKDFVPVTASSYLEFNAPGLIYDIATFYSGDYSNKQIFPYGENRNPITIATTVRNTAGAIFEEIPVPTKNNINTAITNLQRNYATERLLTTNQSLIYRSTYVENNTEMALKIGAHGKYVGFSFDGNMQVSNSRNTKTFFIEAEKELFTLSTETPQGGFLNNADANADRLGYISSVSYGVKIIGKIEVENTAEIFKSQFKAIMDWGFAGG
ncbi:MAG: RICIN domain-containing protein, partial [Chitinophagaceae bacterium]